MCVCGWLRKCRLATDDSPKSNGVSREKNETGAGCGRQASSERSTAKSLEGDCR